jgi:hypothetical protein
MATNRLTTLIEQFDAQNYLLASRNIAFTDATPTLGELRAASLPDTSETTINLIVSIARHVWIRNTHATATLTVKWTPTTGSIATVIVLGPGHVISFWAPTTAATYGISALHLTGSVALTSYELFIGG